jgi:hypothetical protein
MGSADSSGFGQSSKAQNVYKNQSVFGVLIQHGYPRLKSRTERVIGISAACFADAANKRRQPPLS